MDFKILKITFIGLLVSLSSICFGNDSAYSELLGYVKQAHYIEFKNKFDAKAITVEQKYELLSVVNEVIKKEYKYWHTIGSSKSKIKGKDFKAEMKLGYGCAGLFGTISLSTFALLIPSFKKKFKAISDRLSKVQSGKMNPHVRVTAAQEAEFANFTMYLWLRETVWPKVCIVGLLSLCTGLMWWIAKFNKNQLASYKRWKKATKIKKIIETSIFINSKILVQA